MASVKDIAKIILSVYLKILGIVLFSHTLCSRTFWLSKWNIFGQIPDCFESIVIYHQHHLINPTKSTHLQMELTITIKDIFCRATHNLERDSPLALPAYEQFLSSSANSVHCLQTAAVTQKQTGGNQGLYQQLYDYLHFMMCRTST